MLSQKMYGLESLSFICETQIRQIEHFKGNIKTLGKERVEKKSEVSRNDF